MLKIVNRLRSGLINFDSPHTKIALDFCWVILFVALGKTVSVAKEIAIAWRYGTSATVDAYVFLFNLAIWPVSIWFCVLSLVLVPMIARIREENPAELMRFQKEFFGFSILMGWALCLLAWVGLDLALNTNWVRLSEEAYAVATEMRQGLIFFVPFGVVSCFLSAWMLAYRKHANNLLEGIPAIVILAMLLLPVAWLQEPLVWGTVVGYVLYMLSLSLLQKADSGLSLPVFVFESPEWCHFWSGIGLMVVVQILINLAFVIDQFFAANIGAEALSVLGYANRVMAVILALGALAISRASLPIFAEVSARNPEQLTTIVLRWTQWIFIVGAIVVVIGWCVAPLVVQALFERGAFAAEDTLKVSEVLQYALVQVPFYACVLTLSNFVAAQKNYRLLLIATVIGLATKIPAAVILTKLFMLNGLLVSTAVSYLFTLIAFGGLIVINNQSKMQ